MFTGGFIRKNTNIKGSLTVEATLVLSAFLMVVLFFLSIFRMVYAEAELTYAASKTVQEAANVGYVVKNLSELLNQKIDSEQKRFSSFSKFDTREIITLGIDMAEEVGSEHWFAAEIKRKIHGMNNLDKVIKGGFSGISFAGSSVFAEDEITVIHMEYEVTFPVFDDILPGVRFSNVVAMRSFSGEGSIKDAVISQEQDKEEDKEENKEEEKEYVYVTENGTVYHESSACTYLKQVNSDSLPLMRNHSGGKYYACEGCAGGVVNQSELWITPYGNRYHTRKDCTKINRNVSKILKSEAKGYRPCSKCAR